MPLETGTSISDLVSTNPAATDGIVQGDDHIRLLKTVLKTTFPSITGPVTATQTELNSVTANVTGLTSGKYDKTGGSISGAVTVAAGGLTVTAGGLTVTAGGLTVAAGAISFPTISETVQSTSEIATQAEVTTGTDDVRIVSPKKLTEFNPATVTVDPVNDFVLIRDATDSKVKKVAANTVGAQITAGTTLTLNPYTVNTTTTQAHGLGGRPIFFDAYLECVTADAGYTTGQIVPIGMGHTNYGPQQVFNTRVDATNVVLTTHSASTPGIVNASTRAATTIVAANWKLVIVPYRLS